MITNVYDPVTGCLNNTTYGNGQTSSQDYDDLNRPINQKYDDTVIYNYEYDDSGNISYIQDIQNGLIYHYTYDFADRLVSITNDYNSLLTPFDYKYSTNFTYDKNNNISTITDILDHNYYSGAWNEPHITTYTYDTDNRNTVVKTQSGLTVTTAYDTSTDLGRINTKTINTTTPFVSTYNYTPGFGAATGATSKQIASIQYGSNKISYTYDVNGNIKTIKDETTGKTITYYYNELNEVIREDNPFVGTSGNTIVYSYDNGGNIQSKSLYPFTNGNVGTAASIINYSYGDSNWKDKLTSYNGNNITYDTIGNPLSYNGYTYSWIKGKLLESINGNGISVSVCCKIKITKVANEKSKKLQLGIP